MSALAYSPITHSDEAQGRTTVRTPEGTLTLAGACWAQREFPRVGLEVAVDTTNALAFVRDPSIGDLEDPGRPFRLLA